MQNKVKDEFISTLSHEIRTPLTSIKGFSKTILDNWEALNDESKKRFLNIIIEQSDRLINLVENVLDVAKADNEVEIILKEVNLLSLIKNVTDILKMNYKTKNFIIKTPSTGSVNSITNKDKLEQVFTNIIENACKYSGNQNNIEIKIESKADFNIVSIKNFGSHIKEDEIEKVFEKFYRIDNYLTSSAQGSGLGLYIAKNLIEKMQGKIEINSSVEDNYTEFLIYIPVFDFETMAKKVKKPGGQNV